MVTSPVSWAPEFYAQPAAQANAQRNALVSPVNNNAAAASAIPNLNPVEPNLQALNNPQTTPSATTPQLQAEKAPSFLGELFKGLIMQLAPVFLTSLLGRLFA